MMNTLVPRQFFSSYQHASEDEQHHHAAPAPIKAADKAMSTPHTTDCTARFVR